MSTHLENWRERALRSIELHAQADRENVEAEFALAMHKAEAFGGPKNNGGASRPAQSAPQPAYNQQPAPAAQQPNGGGNGGAQNCEDCNGEFYDSGNFTAEQKRASSRKKFNGHTYCIKCQRKREGNGQ